MELTGVDKTIDSLGSNEISAEDSIDNEESAYMNVSSEYGDHSDFEYLYEACKAEVENSKGKSKETKSANKEQEKMELYWRLMDRGFPRDKASEAIYEKGFTDISAATQYLSTLPPNQTEKFNKRQLEKSICFKSSFVQKKPLPTSIAFALENNAPSDHKYFKNTFEPIHAKTFNKAIVEEANILKSSLPEGIFVRGFGDRTDLYSAMLKGPKGTPYEDGLFFFDIQLSADYPKSAPQVHFINYAGKTFNRINPNLYVEGKVCLSILGTWPGKGCENWKPNESNLLQILVSIQGLVLVREPFFNEPGAAMMLRFDKSLTPHRSRMHNEIVIVEVLRSLINQAQSPPDLFEKDVRKHISSTFPQIVRRLKAWLDAKIVESAEATPHSSAYETALGGLQEFAGEDFGFLDSNWQNTINLMHHHTEQVANLTENIFSSKKKEDINVQGPSTTNNNLENKSMFLASNWQNTINQIYHGAEQVANLAGNIFSSNKKEDINVQGPSTINNNTNITVNLLPHGTEQAASKKKEKFYLQEPSTTNNNMKINSMTDSINPFLQSFPKLPISVEENIDPGSSSACKEDGKTETATDSMTYPPPEFPLLPLSGNFRSMLTKLIEQLKSVVNKQPGAN